MTLFFCILITPFTSLSFPREGQLILMLLYYSFVSVTFGLLALFSPFVSLLPVYYVFVYSFLSFSLAFSRCLFVTSQAEF